MAPKNVLFALDHGIVSEHALHWGLKNLVNKEDQVILLHVYNLEPINFYDFTNYVEKLNEARRAAGLELLERKTKECLDLGYRCKGKLSSGDAREIICNGTDRWNIDLVVMGSRGMGVLKRTFLGSVSDYCVHHCKCPVSIVRCDQETEAELEKTLQEKAEKPQSIPEGHHEMEITSKEP